MNINIFFLSMLVYVYGKERIVILSVKKMYKMNIKIDIKNHKMSS